MMAKQFYSFESAKGIDLPCIDIDIQGKTLKMLVDTGCGISIINRESLKGISYHKTDRKVNISAVTSDSLVSNLISIPIKILDREIDVDFAVVDSADLASFKALYGTPLSGMLGTEFLKETNAHIDFNSSIVTLS